MRRSGAAERRPGLLLKALRWRAGLSAAVLVCAAVVVAGAALGPLFARAAAESALQDALAGGATAAALHVQAQRGGSGDLAPEEADGRLDELARVGASRYHPRAVRSLFLRTTGTAPGATDGMVTRMVWRANACAEVRFVTGRCPRGAGEVMISSRSAAEDYGWRYGRPLAVTVDPSPFATDPPLRLTVVGVYRPADSRSPAWSDADYFVSGISGQSFVTDTVFVARSTFARLPDSSPVRAAVDRPLAASAVSLAEVPALRARVLALARAHPVTSDSGVSTGLRSVLARAADEQARIDVATTLVVIQLCVLGWLVLFQVLLDAVDARSADIALAKLRGFGRWALLRFGLGEPVALLALALPVGVVVALGAAHVLAAATLRPGTVVAVPWSVLPAVVAAFAGGLAAVALSARRVLTRPVLEQWRRTRLTQRSGRRGLVIDLLVVLAAAAAFVLLRSAGPQRAGAAVLLGPGLLILAAGLLGARVLPLALRPLVPATAGTSRIALFLAVRQVVRRPAGLRLVALLTVAIGLATFGVAGEGVAAANRTSRAAAELGADRVVRLAVTPGFDPVAAVRRADPGGRWASAAAEWLPFGGGEVQGAVLAIDTARSGAVAAPADGLPAPADLARTLRGNQLAPLRFRGTRLGVTVGLAGVTGSPTPIVRFELRSADGGRVAVRAGRLRVGTAAYTATVPCARGCTLVGVSWERPVEAQGRIGGTAVLSAVRVDGGRFDAHLGKGWRAARTTGQTEDRVTTTAAGIRDEFTSESGDANGIAYPDVPDPVVAAVTPASVRSARLGADLPVQASDGAVARLRVGAVGPVLPVVLGEGLAVDARGFRAALPGFPIDATWSVWLSRTAPPDALQRLRAAGLRLDGPPRTTAERRAELAREGPALALLLLAVTAAAGALLAIGGTTVSIGAAVRRRSYEAAALAAIGVDRARLRRAALVEQLLLLGTAVVVGVPAGLAAVLLALPAIPQSSHASAVPTVSAPPPLPVLVSTLALAGLVVLAGTIAARRVVARGGAQRLREAEE